MSKPKPTKRQREVPEAMADGTPLISHGGGPFGLIQCGYTLRGEPINRRTARSLIYSDWLINNKIERFGHDFLYRLTIAGRAVIGAGGEL